MRGTPVSIYHCNEWMVFRETGTFHLEPRTSKSKHTASFKKTAPQTTITIAWCVMPDPPLRTQQMQNTKHGRSHVLSPFRGKVYDNTKVTIKNCTILEKISFLNLSLMFQIDWKSSENFRYPSRKITPLFVKVASKRTVTVSAVSNFSSSTSSFSISKTWTSLFPSNSISKSIDNSEQFSSFHSLPVSEFKNKSTQNWQQYTVTGWNKGSLIFPENTSSGCFLKNSLLGFEDILIFRTLESFT